MIDLLTEELIPMKDVPKLLPKRGGKRINLVTIYRWTNKGLAGVKLEAVIHGGIRCTSREAIARFDEAVTHVMLGEQKCTEAAEETRARRAYEAAMAELRKL